MLLRIVHFVLALKAAVRGFIDDTKPEPRTPNPEPRKATDSSISDETRDLILTGHFKVLLLDSES
jgi:hypothetical protein